MVPCPKRLSLNGKLCYTGVSGEFVFLSSAKYGH